MSHSQIRAGRTGMISAATITAETSYYTSAGGRLVVELDAAGAARDALFAGHAARIRHTRLDQAVGEHQAEARAGQRRAVEVDQVERDPVGARVGSGAAERAGGGGAHGAILVGAQFFQRRARGGRV